MNNLLKKLTPPEPLGQCDSNFIGMFQTVRFIQMMSLTFGLFTQVSDSGPLGPLVYDNFSYFSPKPYVGTPLLNRLDEMVQKRGYNKCFYA